MKCIKCGTDNNLKERTANTGRCTSCNHPFTFEPTTMTGVKITDPRFKKAIDDLSVNNTLFFTSTQFAYFLDHRLRRTPPTLAGGYAVLLFCYVFFGVFATGFGMIPFIFIFGLIGIAIGEMELAFLYAPITANLCYQVFIIYWLLKESESKRQDNRGRRQSAKLMRILGVIILAAGGVVSLLIIPSFILFSAIVLIGIGALYLGNRQLALPPGSQEFLFSRLQLRDWVQKWQMANQAIPKLLEAPIERLPTASVNSDVSAYSFDRLVVCDRPEVAQFLISNNFHFENNCAVLSINGYPQSIFDTTMQMLHRNPNLKVFVVHDCSPKGMGLVQELQSSDRWFKGRNVLIIDIGITPRHVLSSRRLFIQMSEDSAREAKRANRSHWETLTDDEIKWLEAGNYVELESFTPQRLIQIINLGIAGSRDLSYDDGYSGGDFIFTSDSFG